MIDGIQFVLLMIAVGFTVAVLLLDTLKYRIPFDDKEDV